MVFLIFSMSVLLYSTLGTLLFVYICCINKVDWIGLLLSACFESREVLKTSDGLKFFSGEVFQRTAGPYGQLQLPNPIRRKYTTHTKHKRMEYKIQHL